VLERLVFAQSGEERSNSNNIQDRSVMGSCLPITIIHL
jgi:hypothetical protein